MSIQFVFCTVKVFLPCWNFFYIHLNLPQTIDLTANFIVVCPQKMHSPYSQNQTLLVFDSMLRLLLFLFNLIQRYFFFRNPFSLWWWKIYVYQKSLKETSCNCCDEWSKRSNKEEEEGRRNTRDCISWMKQSWWCESTLFFF